MRGKYIYLLLVAAFGLGVLYFMLWQARLGEFAESPQRVVAQREVTRLVGGGQAGVVFERPYRDDGARLLVRCKDTAEILELEPGEEASPICGVRIRLLEATLHGAELEVRWGEATSSSNEPPDARSEEEE